MAGYDYMNMDDGVIRSGKADVIKFGLNWYPHSHLHVMTNYIHVLDVNTAGVADRRSPGFNNANVDMWITRLQVDFQRGIAPERSKSKRGAAVRQGSIG